MSKNTIILGTFVMIIMVCVIFAFFLYNDKRRDLFKEYQDEYSQAQYQLKRGDCSDGEYLKNAPIFAQPTCTKLKATLRRSPTHKARAEALRYTINEIITLFTSSWITTAKSIFYILSIALVGLILLQVLRMSANPTRTILNQCKQKLK